MTEPSKTPPREIIFRINDIGGITEAEVRLVAGRLNRLQGMNGAGKTSAILAMLRALGDDSVDLEIRDGATLGTIDVERVGGAEEGEESRSRVVVPAKGRIRTQGEPPLTSADVKALTVLITGDHDKGAEPRARKRLDAFLRIVRPQMDEAAASILCERDPEMMAWLGERIADGRVQDLLTAATQLKVELHSRAREKEDAAASWEGQERAHTGNESALLARLAELGLLDPLPEPSPAEAQAGVAEKTRALDRVESAAEARVKQEALQAHIREVATERPDVAGAEAETNGHAAAYQDARIQVGVIEREIAVLQERLAAVAARRDSALKEGKEAEQRWRTIEKEAAAWDEMQALLQQEITGPGPEDVDRAAIELTLARRIEEQHRLSLEVLKARAEADTARKKRARETDRGKQLRAWAKAVPARVADVLAQQGASGFTVLDGRLAYELNGGPAVDFDTRLSTGQQIAAAFELAGGHFQGLVYVAPEFYASLDDEHKAWVNQFAADRPDLFVITEEPTAGSLSVAYGHEGGAS